LNILIIDDEIKLADVLVKRMAAGGHRASAAYTGADGLAAAQALRPDVILCDLKLPDMRGLDLLPKLLEQLPEAKVMVMTGGSSTADAVTALKLGAEDYLEKPFDLEELVVKVQKLGQHQDTEKALGNLKKAGTRDTLDRLRVYMGAGMKKVYDDIAVAAAEVNVPVLLLGETGSGKEHAARLLHQLSQRFAGPFVELNCASIPEALVESELFGSEAGAYTDSKRRRIGLFEAAQGGTLFLDEIGELSSATQAKLLKVLENRELRRVGATESIRLDIRIVAATNRDLEAEARAGRFRSDLYYRLNLFTVRLPPLRERQGDIPDLARFLFDRACQDFGRRLTPFCETELADLSARAWPGNVRELRNVIESAVLRSRDGHAELALGILGGSPPVARGSTGIPRPMDKAPELRPLSEAVDEAVQKVKRELLVLALHKSNGNKSEAARLLKVDIKTILNLQKSLGLT
jgi:two-component system response regulator AtoC